MGLDKSSTHNIVIAVTHHKSHRWLSFVIPVGFNQCRISVLLAWNHKRKWTQWKRNLKIAVLFQWIDASTSLKRKTSFIPISYLPHSCCTNRIDRNKCPTKNWKDSMRRNSSSLFRTSLVQLKFLVGCWATLKTFDSYWWSYAGLD